MTNKNKELVDGMFNEFFCNYKEEKSVSQNFDKLYNLYHETREFISYLEQKVEDLELSNEFIYRELVEMSK